jgi:hypothetical protein
MPFFIILTSIPSTKVAFSRVISLQRGSKNGGKRINEETKMKKKDAAKISETKTDVTGVLVFNVLNEHPWITKTFCPENLAIVNNNRPFQLT